MSAHVASEVSATDFSKFDQYLTVTTITERKLCAYFVIAILNFILQSFAMKFLTIFHSFRLCIPVRGICTFKGKFHTSTQYTENVERVFNVHA